MKSLDNLREICNRSDHNEVEVSMTGFSELLKLELKGLSNFTGFGKTIDLNELHQVSNFFDQISKLFLLVALL